jgi:Na+/H+-dicarboxylate symporter
MGSEKNNKSREIVIILGALILSFIIGVVFKSNAAISGFLKPIGDIYIHLLKLTMIPLVTTSIVISIAKMSNIQKAGKIGGLTLLIFICTTAFAVSFGVLFSMIIKAGTITPLGNLEYEGKEMPAIAETIIGIFPDNVLQTLTEGKILPVIVLSVILGIAIDRVKSDEVASLQKVIEGINQVTKEVLGWVIKITPLGISGLMTPIVIDYGWELIIPLVRVLLVYYSLLVIYNALSYGILLKYFARKSICDFYKKTATAQIFAFVSCSSMATLPISMKIAKERLKLSDEVSGFVLPLGATVNMDGNALYQGVIAVFVAQVFGINLSINSIIAIIVVGTFASIGAAGVPGAGVIVLSAVLSAAGLPIEGVALVAGIDRIFDMGRTHTNVTGDIVTACVVDKCLENS